MHMPVIVLIFFLQQKVVGIDCKKMKLTEQSEKKSRNINLNTHVASKFASSKTVVNYF